MLGLNFNTGANAAPQIENKILPAVLGVAANSTAYLQLPIGYRYHFLHLLYGGTTFDNTYMSAIRLYANQSLFQNFTGTQRDVWNQFDGLSATSTYKDLVIPFERIGMAEDKARYITAINTGSNSKGTQCPVPITDFRIEIDIAGATAPTLAMYADVSDVNTEQSVMLPRIDRWTENVAATGEFLHLNSARFIKDKLRPYTHRIWLGDTDTNITNFRLLRDLNQEFKNRTTKENENAQTSIKVRTPQAGWVAIDWGERGEFANLFDGINCANLELRSTHAATNAALPVIQESMGPLMAS